jgi:hypothetical protein
LNISLDKINGSGEFGFSGENKTLNFKFISGLINDFNNNTKKVINFTMCDNNNTKAQAQAAQEQAAAAEAASAAAATADKAKEAEDDATEDDS